MDLPPEVWKWIILACILIGYFFGRKQEPEVVVERIEKSRPEPKFKMAGIYLQAVDALSTLGVKRTAAKTRIEELARRKQYYDIEELIRDAFKTN